MIPTGIRGNENIDKNIPQGNTVLGTTSLNSVKTQKDPVKGERYLAELQGKTIAKVSLALKGTFMQKEIIPTQERADVNKVLQQNRLFYHRFQNPPETISLSNDQAIWYLLIRLH